MPFKGVAVDIVGLIAALSKAGHRYILTIVDYATSNQEDYYYSRVGIPEEVLTQFMSECMQEVSRLHSIKGLTMIHTIPFVMDWLRDGTDP